MTNKLITEGLVYNHLLSYLNGGKKYKKLRC